MEALEFVAKIDSRGRITIPQTTRTILDLNDGDFVIIKIENAQKVRARNSIPTATEVE